MRAKLCINDDEADRAVRFKGVMIPALDPDPVSVFSFLAFLDPVVSDPVIRGIITLILQSGPGVLSIA